MTDASIYNRMGGEDAIRELVKVFYDIIEFEPVGDNLRILHLRHAGIAHSRIEQFNYLCGFFGGPNLYAEKHGHSNVREMHEHVEVNMLVRDDWLKCMDIAMDRLKYDPKLKKDIMDHFTVVAHALKNTD